MKTKNRNFKILKELVRVTTLCLSTVSYAQSTSTFQYIAPQLKNAGYQAYCFLDSSGVECWGNPAFGIVKNQLGLEKTKGATYLATNAFGLACVIQKNLQINCWGDSSSSALPPASLTLKKPQQLELAKSFGCLLDSGEVKCWGVYATTHQMSVPDLNHPYKISVSGDTACALDDDGLKCWGYNAYIDYPNSSAPYKKPYQNPYDLRTLTDSNDDGGIFLLQDHDQVYWDRGTSGSLLKLLPKKLDNLTDIQFYYENTVCAILNNSVQCWSNAFKQLPPSDIQNPSQVAPSWNSACALHDGGIACWGNNDYNQLNVPARLKNTNSSIVSFAPRASAFSNNYKKLVNYLTTAKGTLLDQASNALDFVELNTDSSVVKQRTWLKQAQGLSLNLLAPFFDDLSGAKFESQLKPQYKIALETINSELGVDVANDIPVNSRTRMTALMIIKGALDALKVFASLESDRAILDDLVKQIGVAMSNADRDLNQSLRAVQAIKKTSLITQVFLMSPLSKGITQTLLTSCNFIDR